MAQQLDPQDSGYQARQAKFALAQGGIFGDGLGQSVAKSGTAPNARNDFISPSSAKGKLGLVGAPDCWGYSDLFACTVHRLAGPPTRSWRGRHHGTLWVLGQAFINIGCDRIAARVYSCHLRRWNHSRNTFADRHHHNTVATNRRRWRAGAGRDDKVSRLLRLPLPEVSFVSKAFRDRKRATRNRPKQPRERPRTAPGQPARRMGLRPARRTSAGSSISASWALGSGTPASVAHGAFGRGRSALRVKDTVSQPAGGRGTAPRPRVHRLLWFLAVC